MQATWLRNLGSLTVTSPSGSAVTRYVASRPSSITGDDIWMSSGRSTLAVKDLTTEKRWAKWVTVGSLLYLLRYGDFFFSSKELQEYSLDSLVSKKAPGLLKDGIVSWGMFFTILPSDVG